MEKPKLEDIFIIKESDLAGIDELVYNPVTGNPADEYDKGSDGGRLQKSITWPGHDDHLHIGTTNKEVMIQLINQAQQMGLSSTENPYAKNDSDGKVGKHAAGSFHYKRFSGVPSVGAGVDISGDRTKIREFIRWINANYKGKNLQQDQTTEQPDQSNNTKTDTKTDTKTTPALTPSTGSTVSGFTDTYGVYDGLSNLINPLVDMGKEFKNKWGKSTNESKITGESLINEEIDRIKQIMKS